MTKHLARVPSLLLLLLSLTFFACQQTNEPEQNTQNETVSGILQDEQGHSLPGALIEAINSANAVLDTAHADEDGKFTLDLPTNVAGIKLRISRGDLKPFLRDLAEFIQKAGGRLGLILDGEHDDSCCGKVSLTVTGLNEEINHAEVKLRYGNGMEVASKAYTNDNGRLTFAHVCEGAYNIRIAKDGFKVKEFTLEVGAECDSVGYAVELESNGTIEDDSCCGSTFTFAIKDSATNESINGVQIKIRRGDQDAIIKNTENGGAHFTELCEGIYSVRIAKDGYKVQEFSIEVGCDTEGEIVKYLASTGHDECCDGVVEIVAKNAEGHIIEGAVVRLWKGNDNIRTETMHDGIRWADLCEGNYSVSIQAEGYTGQEFSFELDCNGVKGFVKTLVGNNNHGECCEGVLWLIVNKDDSDIKLGGVTVKLWKGGQIYKTGTTNEQGLVKFEDICEGSYGVSMMKDGYAGKEFDGLVFECNDSVELHKAMVANGGGEDCCTGILKLRIKDSTNMVYMNGATVKIYKGNDLLETVESREEGWAIADGLCNNSTYTVVVMKDGYITKEAHFTYNECKTIQETIWLKHE
ncbi:MAG TPA: carboxypeptidase regulatory-like domain-containing protein [Candidatus Kapabacteria bacterium]|nr:carboxypeptidase regulatory-like domain-containing protein [Candidatus Kapabacteria bacterium]